MTYVMDANAAVEIILKRTFSFQFEQILSKAKNVIAPDIFISEVTNVFWKYHKYENFPVERCEISLHASIRMIDTFVQTKTLYREALHLACNTQHSAYDMMYLVLCRHENGVLLTLDRKLIDIANNYSLSTHAI